MISFIREKGYLLAAGIAVVCIGVVLFIPGKKPSGDVGKASPGRNPSESPTDVSGLPAKGVPAKPSDLEEAKATIAAHEKKVAEDPRNPDAPAYLMAAGDLHKNVLMDYENAVQCYERLLMDYPEYKNISRAYLSLEFCHKQRRDMAKVRDVHRRMILTFPEDTQEYLYARRELGL